MGPRNMTVELPVVLNRLASDGRAFGLTLRVEERSAESMPGLLASFGFAHPEEKLFPISREAAAEVISHLVAYDQAYGFPTSVIAIADDCGREFVSLFPEESRFFTNSSEPLGAAARAWHPLTDATFDAGVLAVSPNRVGVLWLEDED
jgi:hypothetical protein